MKHLFLAVIVGVLTSCNTSGKGLPLSLEQQLVMCAYFGDEEGVRQLLPQVDVNAVAGRRFTGHVACAKWTALHAAADQKRIGIVKVLVDAGADINADDGYGGTPLYYAIRSYEDPSYDEVALFLVGRGSRVNTKTKVYIDGPGDITPLHVAAMSGRKDVVCALIKAGADVNVQDSLGTTPLHLACFRADTDTVQALLSAGADPRVTDSEGALPSYHCTDPAVLELLMRAGAPPPPAEVPNRGDRDLTW